MYSQRAAAMANIITIIIITALAGWISLLHPQKNQKDTRIICILHKSGTASGNIQPSLLKTLVFLVFFGFTLVLAQYSWG